MGNINSFSKNAVIPEKDFRLAEYDALRTEILKRIELEHQTISFTLIAAAAAFGAALQTKNSLPLFAYPILASFLLLILISNTFHIRYVAKYIKERVEDNVEDNGGGNPKGWQHYKEMYEVKTCYQTSFFGFNILIITTQAILLIGGLSLNGFQILALSPLERALATIGLITTIFSIILVICNSTSHDVVLPKNALQSRH